MNRMIPLSTKLAILCICALVMAAMEWLTKRYLVPILGNFFASVIMYIAYILTLFVLSRLLMRLFSKSKKTHIPIIGAPFNVKHSSV